MSGTFHGRVGPPRSIRHTEMLVSAYVCAGAQPLQDGHGKVQGGFPDPLREGGATHPWPAPVCNCQPSQGERRDPIGGGGGSSSTTPTPTQGGRTYPPLHGALQAMSTVGIPRGTVKDLPAEGAVGVPGRPVTSHVEHGGDPPVFGMDNPGTYSEGGHQHKRHRPFGDPVEGGGGSDRHSPLRQTTDARRNIGVQGRKKYGDGYNGVKACPGACQD